ncbi:hypothetical protein F5X68DRAFT_237247 [Plectosphaerella plurivora]|uniref:F-box domain-containing protein n=1 Tax=Plectosphaerella plurivora TaxID=936078 RepID=A0A9P8V1Z8_9PEZI|nr:hypothetical protein F5X68DRAFT_237247 [Plectosphaerella plurivora]
MASSSSGLGSLPPEILGHILQQCDSAEDIKAMICTCRFVHRTWEILSSSIIIAYGRTNIPCFDLALMAIRATALVHEAEKRCAVPPAIDPDTITVAARAPSPAEFSTVRDMYHFGSCARAKYFDHPRPGLTPFTHLRWNVAR